MAKPLIRVFQNEMCFSIQKCLLVLHVDKSRANSFRQILIVGPGLLVPRFEGDENLANF